MQLPSPLLTKKKLFDQKMLEVVRYGRRSVKARVSAWLESLQADCAGKQEISCVDIEKNGPDSHAATDKCQQSIGKDIVKARETRITFSSLCIHRIYRQGGSRSNSLIRGVKSERLPG
jgi:hypothetical protein